MTAVLYAAKAASASTSDLYTLDPSTAAPTSIGATGHAFTSLAFDPTTGILYGTTSAGSSANPDSLYTLDPSTGAATLVGAMGGTVSDIAIDASGQMWGWTRDTSHGGLGGSFSALLRINKADASFAVIGSSGLNMQGSGISFHSNGTLYGLIATSGSGRLYTINTTTGALTSLGIVTTIPAAAAFDAADKLYFLLGGGGGPTSLRWIDVGSLAITTIGNPGDNFDALAWTVTGGGGGGLTTPEGFCIAFDDDALEPTPVWTRLDDPDAPIGRLRVSQVSIDRGMEGTSGTVKTGTAAITLHDPYGELDPTNAGSPFYGKLDPCLQAAYARWNPVTSTWSTRFRGFVKAYRTTMSTSGFAEVVIELVDAFDLFATLRLTPGDQGDTPRTESVGDIFYAGGSPIPADDTFKHVDDRQHQALDDAGWPLTMRDIFSGNVSVQEQVYERDGQLIEVLADAADAEFPDVSRAYMSREGIYRFRGRYARFFPDHVGYGITTWILGGAAEAEADAGVVKIQNFSFRRSSEDIINVATALPKGLDDTDVPGQMVTDATSIAKFWRRPWMSDNLLTWHGHDDVGATVLAAPETKKFAQFKVDNFKDPKTRIEQIVVTWQHPSGWSGPANWAFLQGVELGDIVSVDTTHPGGGGFAEDYYVEAIREVDEPGPNAATRKVITQLDVSPKSFYASNPFGTVDDGAS